MARSCHRISSPVRRSDRAPRSSAPITIGPRSLSDSDRSRSSFWRSSRRFGSVSFSIRFMMSAKRSNLFRLDSAAAVWNP